MDEEKETVEAKDGNVRAIVREAIEEFVKKEQSKTEPAYKAELVEERKRREQLERRLNELVEENKRSRQQAEEAERSGDGAGGVAAHGRGEGGRGVQGGQGRHRTAPRTAGWWRGASGGEVSLREYSAHFREREPGIPAGAHLRGSGSGIGAQAAGSERRGSGGPGQDPAGDERGGIRAGPAGNRANCVADAAGSLKKAEVRSTKDEVRSERSE